MRDLRPCGRWAGFCALILLAGFARPDVVPGGILAVALPPDVAWVTYEARPVLIRDGTALVGINIGSPAGRHVVQLLGETTRTHPFEVVAKQYPEQHITLADPKMVNPDPEDLRRIAREASRMEAVYLHFSQGDAPSRLDKPVHGVTSSPFGFRRVFNGEPRNPHSGLDIAAGTGTPVRAPAAGTVRLTGDFYFNGLSVFLDHGQGLITMVCHLSAIKVKEGDVVPPRTVLGLVGASGRATGPHLHWSVSMNGNRVDPVQAMHFFGVD